MSLPWFKVATDFADHPKTHQLADELGISQVTAVGIVVRGWCWVAKYCPLGDIPARQVSALMKTVGGDIYQQFDADPLHPIDQEVVFAALISCGWIDVKRGGWRRFHQWDEFNSSYFLAEEHRKSRDRERKKSKEIPRKLQGNSTEFHSLEGEGEGE